MWQTGPIICDDTIRRFDLVVSVATYIQWRRFNWDIHDHYFIRDIPVAIKNRLSPVCQTLRLVASDLFRFTFFSLNVHTKILEITFVYSCVGEEGCTVPQVGCSHGCCRSRAGCCRTRGCRRSRGCRRTRGGSRSGCGSGCGTSWWLWLYLGRGSLGATEAAVLTSSRPRFRCPRDLGVHSPRGSASHRSPPAPVTV